MHFEKAMQHILAVSLAMLLAGCAMQSGTRVSSSPASAVHAAQPTQAARTPLLLISIDGYRSDYLQRKQSPTLSSMAANGVRAKAMQPSFPSLTFPNHYTLVTGLYPDHQGIVNNTMYDSKLGKFSLRNRKAVETPQWWAEGEPIWVTADRQGLKTGTMFWPGSEARIHGLRPDYWHLFDGRVTPAQRVDQILAWLDLPAAQRPTFLTLYFDDVDHAGHEYGPDTDQVDAAIRKVDSAISRLVTGLRARGLYQNINIIVVSDHGMASVPKGHLVIMDDLIDLSHVRAVSMGILAGFNPKPGYADSISRKLLGRHDHMTCWKRKDIPARFHYGSNPRIPDISCLADVGWQISNRGYLKRRKRPMSLGEHGYDNASPLMRALFIAHGPAFRKGATIAEFPNVDVYPLMTQLLRIKPQPNDGSIAPFEGALKAGSTSASASAQH
ncbi:MAG: ectonucleotide pyrophosphatase/phosphodiesterase [Rhodanobacteraceae bacterium]